MKVSLKKLFFLPYITLALFLFFPLPCSGNKIVFRDTYKILPLSEIKDAYNACIVSSDTPKSNWVGLVKDNGCSFWDKYNNLRKMGASGIIIESEKFPDGSVFFIDKTKFLVVPIKKDLYELITKNYLSDKGRNDERDLPIVEVDINSPSVRMVFTSLHIPAFPFIQALYILFLVIMIFVFPALFDQINSASAQVLSSKELLSLQEETYSLMQQSSVRYFECPICLDAFLPLSRMRILRCKHYFHSECIDPWLLTCSNRCPICSLVSSTAE